MSTPAEDDNTSDTNSIESAWAQSRADVAAGRFVIESVQVHMERLDVALRDFKGETQGDVKPDE